MRGPEINKTKPATAPPATSPSCGQQPLHRPGGPSRSSSIAPPKPSFAAPDSSAPTRQGIKRTSPKCRRESTPETPPRSEEHTPELQSLTKLVCRLLLVQR